MRWNQLERNRIRESEMTKNKTEKKNWGKWLVLRL